MYYLLTLNRYFSAKLLLRYYTDLFKVPASTLDNIASILDQIH